MASNDHITNGSFKCLIVLLDGKCSVDLGVLDPIIENFPGLKVYSGINLTHGLSHHETE